MTFIVPKNWHRSSARWTLRKECTSGSVCHHRRLARSATLRRRAYWQASASPSEEPETEAARAAGNSEADATDNSSTSERTPEARADGDSAETSRRTPSPRPVQPREQQPPIGPRRQKPKEDEFEEVGSAEVDLSKEYKIWPGSWICVDCGWEYPQDAETPLELQPETFRCPQCGARKRRFAKKAGKVIQVTKDTSNVPILVMSALGVVAVVAFGIWAANKL